MNKIIDIPYQKTCDCPPKHLSCLEPREWMKCQLGVWSFSYEGRDIKDKKLHPAPFPIALPRKVIELFTHKGELVLDPFVGSGSTVVAAQDCGRNVIGFDLNQKYIVLARSRIDYMAEGRAAVVCDDARNISQYIKTETVKLIITSPPYANILNRPKKNKSRRGEERHNEEFGQVVQYSQDERDLGILEPSDFEKAICEIFGNIKPVMKKNGHIVINITDAWIDGKRIPLHINIINAMKNAGYQHKNTIIWDRRNIVNRIGIFGWPTNYITMGTTFEYLLDFTL